MWGCEEFAWGHSPIHTNVAQDGNGCNSPADQVRDRGSFATGLPNRLCVIIRKSKFEDTQRSSEKKDYVFTFSLLIWGGLCEIWAKIHAEWMESESKGIGAKERVRRMKYFTWKEVY